MFESIWRLTPKEFKKRHVMAVDISTSAISAILAIKHERQGGVEILKVLKSPFDLLGENVSEKKIQHILRESILKIFKDAHAILRHLDDIIVVLSDPFFSDLTFSKKISCPHQGAKVGESEVAALLNDLKKDAEPKNGQLVLVGEETLALKINGYDVADAIGYKGKSIEMSAVFTFVNKFIQEAVLDAREKCFPRSRLTYISDSRLIRKFLLRIRALDEPSILFDIDGEATGIYFLSKDVIRHLGITAFGSKTLERRVAHVSRYASGALETALNIKAETELKPALLSWWEGVLQYLKQLDETGYPKKCFIVGRDTAANIFLPYLANYCKSSLNFKPDAQFFSVEPLRDFLYPPSVISQKQDILLASLFY